MASSIKAQARKVVCIGRNYADHIAELHNARPKRPFFFLKPPSSILARGEGPVRRPSGVDLHFEVELALVLGKQVRDLDEGDERAALDAVDSYAVAIDMTARNAQNVAKRQGLPWTAAKGFDTFLPLSERIPKSALPDPHSDVELFLSVNGEIRQQDPTSLMLFRIPTILSHISRIMTLERGDVVLTGTPKGVGSVQVGDVMRAGIRVGGKEVEEGRIEVGVEEKGGIFRFEEDMKD
ncbi:hypothetical protein MMC07_006881 [Pseudocyphellaria aurata]|nr:hypothetical protein [Pseudocyphellaria aurata]